MYCNYYGYIRFYACNCTAEERRIQQTLSLSSQVNGLGESYRVSLWVIKGNKGLQPVKGIRAINRIAFLSKRNDKNVSKKAEWSEGSCSQAQTVSRLTRTPRLFETTERNVKYCCIISGCIFLFKTTYVNRLRLNSTFIFAYYM